MNILRFLTLLVTFAALWNGCAPPPTTPVGETPAPVVVPALPVMTKAEAPVHTVDITNFALMMDPVCKMSFEEYAATASAEHGGKTYGFCSEFCKKSFLKDPDKLLARLTEPAPPADATP